jgi:predicted ATPase
MLGYPDLGLSLGRELVSFTRTLAHPHSLAFALAGLAWGHLSSREWPAAQRVGEELITMSSEQGFPFWATFGRCIVGRAQVHQGGGSASAALVPHGLAELKAMGMANFYTVCLPWAAEVAGAVGQAEEGLRDLANTLRLLEQTDQRYAEAELYYIKGRLFEQLASPDTHEAEASYHTAIEVARLQQTKLLELRAAANLSRLWQHQGKHAEARDLLSPIYGWFTEASDTPDIDDASAILHALAQPI